MMRVPCHKGKQNHSVFNNGGGVLDEIVEIPCCCYVGVGRKVRWTLTFIKAVQSRGQPDSILGNYVGVDGSRERTHN